ncbi:MAG: chorismate--pyruvate lyase [Mobilitalea sp.]
MFERIEYVVARIDGDYAYLQRCDLPDEDLKCVARALLPAEIRDGSKLAYELLSYELA